MQVYVRPCTMRPATPKVRLVRALERSPDEWLVLFVQGKKMYGRIMGDAAAGIHHLREASLGGVHIASFQFWRVFSNLRWVPCALLMKNLLVALRQDLYGRKRLSIDEAGPSVIAL
jgi:hypothetical protein